jgi:heat shock protein HtpX
VSHIKRDDTRILGLAAVLAQATRGMSLVGQFLVFLNIPLLLMGQVTVSWTAILLLLLAPGLSGALHLALSRAREYDADLGAVDLTGDPRGLASALHRLEELNRGLLHRLFPGRVRIPVPAFLRTHPETEERIRRLLRLEREPRAQRSERMRARRSGSGAWPGDDSSYPRWPFLFPFPGTDRGAFLHSPLF